MCIFPILQVAGWQWVTFALATPVVPGTLVETPVALATMPKEISETETKIKDELHGIVWHEYLCNGGIYKDSDGVIARYLDRMQISKRGYSTNPHMTDLFKKGGRAYTVEYIRFLYAFVELPIPTTLQSLLDEEVLKGTSMKTEKTKGKSCSMNDIRLLRVQQRSMRSLRRTALHSRDAILSRLSR
jgi:hypothetical protein